jgi:membrane-anchored mycosin MYCP
MDVRQGWVEKFHGDELIVALPQLRAVQAALNDYGVRSSDVDENETLGLARLSGLTGIEAAARQLAQHPDIGPELMDYRNERNETHPHAPELSDLALLIKGLRLLLADQHPGWQVAIGKNYRPSLIKGYPHTGGGGEGEPTPTDEPFTAAVDPAAANREPGFGVRVGLLDTRLYPHPQLAGRYVGCPDDLLPAGQQEFTEFDGHCTFVASCILQQAPAAQLELRHVLDRQGNGSAWDAALGIAKLVPLDLDVVNLSFGEYMTDDDSAPLVLDAAIRRFSRDTVVVAAAGNNGDADTRRPPEMPPGVTARTTSYPAALPDVLAVGAIDADGKPARFNPEDAPWISLLARGVDVNAAYLRGDMWLPNREQPVSFSATANWAGCSFAAGVVTGVIAARTEPGRTSSREALDDLMATLRRQPWPGLLIS